MSSELSDTSGTCHVCIFLTAPRRTFFNSFSSINEKFLKSHKENLTSTKTIIPPHPLSAAAPFSPRRRSARWKRRRRHLSDPAAMSEKATGASAAAERIARYKEERRRQLAAQYGASAEEKRRGRDAAANSSSSSEGPRTTRASRLRAAAATKDSKAKPDVGVSLAKTVNHFPSINWYRKSGLLCSVLLNYENFKRIPLLNCYRFSRFKLKNT